MKPAVILEKIVTKEHDLHDNWLMVYKTVSISPVYVPETTVDNDQVEALSLVILLVCPQPLVHFFMPYAGGEDVIYGETP